MRLFRPLAFALLAALLAAPAYGQATPASAPGASRSTTAPVSAHAGTLFERDWVLANWALKKFDGDRDILLSNGESAAAASEFRKIADGNGDGRVTQAEYRAAREFILARY